jgi:hypothetical protein
MLGFGVRIPPETRMSVCFECCVLSGRGHCVGLITHPEESYRVWCVWEWSWSLDNEETIVSREKKTYLYVNVVIIFPPQVKIFNNQSSSQKCISKDHPYIYAQKPRRKFSVVRALGSLNFVQLALKFAAPQLETWHLEFWSGSQIFGQIMRTCTVVLRIYRWTNMTFRSYEVNIFNLHDP